MAAVFLLGAAATEHYVLHRYRKMAAMPIIYIGRKHDARIAIVGFSLQHPLTGSDNSNHVQYVAVSYGRAESADRGLPVVLEARSAEDDGRPVKRVLPSALPG